MAHPLSRYLIISSKSQSSTSLARTLRISAGFLKNSLSATLDLSLVEFAGVLKQSGGQRSGRGRPGWGHGAGAANRWANGEEAGGIWSPSFRCAHDKPSSGSAVSVDGLLDA
jgi:hypothetical protein